MLQSSKYFLLTWFISASFITMAQTKFGDQMQRASIQNSSNSIIQQNKNGTNTITINVSNKSYKVPTISYVPNSLNPVVFFDTFQGSERYKLLVWNETNKVAYNVKGSVYLIHVSQEGMPYGGLIFNGIIDYPIFNPMTAVEIFTSAKYDFIANIEFAVIIKGTYSYSAKGKHHEFSDIKICNLMERKMIEVTDMLTKKKAYEYLVSHENILPKYIPDN